MDNTVQMHKTVPSPRHWRAITIKHDHWRQRTYVPVTAGAARLAKQNPTSTVNMTLTRDSETLVSQNSQLGKALEMQVMMTL